jgi:uncharacterized alpha-E superfamily protein
VNDVDTPIDDIQWAAVLRSISGLQMYRTVHGRLAPLSIADFMLRSPDFPRSVRHCVAEVDDAVRCIAEGAENEATFAASRLRQFLDNADSTAIVHSGLHEFIDSMQTSLNDLGVVVSKTYFEAHPVMAAAGL